jgi:hypothetical protein
MSNFARREFDFSALVFEEVAQNSRTRPLCKLIREFSHSLGRQQTLKSESCSVNSLGGGGNVSSFDLPCTEALDPLRLL